ncbi:MAG: polysaccharide deacetylase family protein [Syntrophomonas sp.]
MEWSSSLILIFFLAVLSYTFIPDLLLHRLGIGSFKRHYGPGVVVTFDDGPDPLVTPLLIDILERLEIKAVFFVVGENAEKHPELIKHIKARGHQLGAHCQHHRHAWLMSPRKTWREWDDCIKTLEDITGEPVEWIRPPWGFFSLATFVWMRARKKRAVLYTVEGHDWQLKRSPEQICQRIVNKAQEGSIILLHDSGPEKGAPLKMLESLEGISMNIRDTGKLAIIALDFPTWPLRRRVVFSLWERWERIFARLNHIEKISSTNILRLSQTRYKGPDLYTPEGQLIAARGDLVGEIHLANSRLAIAENNSVKTAAQVLKQAREDLPELAEYIESHPHYQDVKVFMGLSIINRGVQMLGFHVQDVAPTLFNRAVSLLQHTIHRIYNPTGQSAVHKHDDHPKLVWISKGRLIELWLPKSAEY